MTMMAATGMTTLIFARLVLIPHREGMTQEGGKTMLFLIGLLAGVLIPHREGMTEPLWSGTGSGGSSSVLIPHREGMTMVALRQSNR